jgi:hypothetical protein
VGVDLERGAVSLDKNKTNDPRSWALDQRVLRALKTYVRLRDAQVGAPLFTDDDGAPFDNRKLAQVLRADLEVSLANGKTETWVGRPDWPSVEHDDQRLPPAGKVCYGAASRLAQAHRPSRP